jgi:hypothetical protein
MSNCSYNQGKAENHPYDDENTESDSRIFHRARIAGGFALHLSHCPFLALAFLDSQDRQAAQHQ